MNPSDKNLRLSHAIFENLPQWLEESGDYSYILNFPALKQTKIGICPRQIITYRSGQITISEPHDKRVLRSDDKSVIGDLRDVLMKGKAYFCMGSIDLNRKLRDEDLPLLLFIQPGIEIHLDYNEKDPLRVIADDCDVKEHLERQIRSLSVCPEPERSNVSYGKQYSQKIATNGKWQGESDESFMARIRDTVKLLKQTSSKIIITRCYHKKISSTLSPFHLYRIYTLMEKNCVASHFFQMPDNIFSLGCSPENIFEIVNSEIYTDAVSATRAVVSDAAKDARYLGELQNDPKEQLEHEMTVDRCCDNLRQMCVPESIQRGSREILKLRKVRHLRTVVSASLREQQDFFDVLQKRYPSLNAYESKLIPLTDRMQSPARFYGGMVGWLSPDRKEIRCFQNLRTALVKADTLYLGGGMGVMQKSQPELELLEVRNKLQCLRDAIALWENVSAA